MGNGFLLGERAVFVVVDGHVRLIVHFHCGFATFLGVESDGIAQAGIHTGVVYGDHGIGGQGGKAGMKQIVIPEKLNGASANGKIFCQCVIDETLVVFRADAGDHLHGAIVIRGVADAAAHEIAHRAVGDAAAEIVHQTVVRLQGIPRGAENIVLSQIVGVQSGKTGRIRAQKCFQMQKNVFGVLHR